MKNHQIIVKSNEERVIPIFWNGLETEISYDIFLSEPGANVSVLGLLLGKKENELNIHINVTHQAPNTKSEVILKGVLRDLSKINFEGLVKINKGAIGTKSWLAAYLLILSDQAKGRAIPSLEISENDIKAGHATTVGKVNDIEMFYLQSRGLSTKSAKNLIVNGFLLSILERLPKNLQQKAQREIKND